jgi:membrane protein DedA with SNARE-associated domain
VAIIARVLVTYVPESFWIAIGPYWLIIAGTIATWVGTQVWYHIGVRPRKREQEEREYQVIE